MRHLFKIIESSSLIQVFLDISGVPLRPGKSSTILQWAVTLDHAGTKFNFWRSDFCGNPSTLRLYNGRVYTYFKKGFPDETCVMSEACYPNQTHHRCKVPVCKHRQWLDPGLARPLHRCSNGCSCIIASKPRRVDEVPYSSPLLLSYFPRTVPIILALFSRTSRHHSQILSKPLRFHRYQFLLLFLCTGPAL